jgi:hypothetical protein
MRRWKGALVHPWRPHPDGETVYCALPDGAEDPAYWAGVLDSWVRRHAEPTDAVARNDEERAVSAGLNTDPFLVLLTEEKLVRQQALDLQARRIAGESPIPAEVAEFHRRRQAMLAWIDEVLPTADPASLRDALRRGRDGLVHLADLVPVAPEPTP